MIVEQYPELTSLSTEQKLTLADELTHLAVSEQDSGLRALVRDRWAEYQANPAAAQPWEQVMAEVLASMPHV